MPNKMSQPKSIKVIVFLFGKAIGILATFLFLPYLVRALSIESYGTYGQTILIIELGKAVAGVGLSTVIFVFLSKSEYDKKEVFQNNLWSSIIFGLLFCGLLFVFSDRVGAYMNNERMGDLLRIYCLSLPFYLIYEVSKSALIFYDKVKTVTLAEVFFNLIKLSLMLISVQVFGSLPLVFYTLLLYSIASALFFYIKLPKTLKTKYAINLKLIKEQISVGVPLGITGVLSFLILSTDSMMISSMMGVEDYAIYRNGAIQLPFIATLYFSISTIIFPDINKYLDKNEIDKMVRLKQKAISLSVILVYPTLIFFLFFSKYFVVFYLTEQYEKSAIVFLIYNLVVFVRINNYRDILISYKKTKFILYTVMMSFIVNIALNYLFIHLWGAKGAALASLISLVALVTTMFIRTTSLVHRRFADFFDWVMMVKVAVLAAIFSVLAYSLFRGVPQSFLMLVIFFTVYSTIVYYLIIKFSLVEKKMIYPLTDRLPWVGGKVKNLIQKI